MYVCMYTYTYSMHMRYVCIKVYIPATPRYRPLLIIGQDLEQSLVRPKLKCSRKQGPRSTNPLSLRTPRSIGGRYLSEGFCFFSCRNHPGPFKQEDSTESKAHSHPGPAPVKLSACAAKDLLRLRGRA